MRDVLHALGQPQEAGLLEVGLDGQHLKGGAGDKAIVLVLAYLSRLQSKAAGDEAGAGRGLMMEVGAALAEARIPWTRPRRPRSSRKKGAPLPPSQGQSGRAEGLGRAPAAVPAGRCLLPSGTQRRAVGLAGSYHRSLRWPFLVCNRRSRCTATRPTNAAVKSARKPTSLSPAQANAASLGGIGPSRTGSTTKEIPSWVRTPVAPAKLPSPSPLCATFCWVSYTSSPPLCFAVFVASPPIPCPSIAGSVGV